MIASAATMFSDAAAATQVGDTYAFHLHAGCVFALVCYCSISGGIVGELTIDQHYLVPPPLLDFRWTSVTWHAQDRLVSAAAAAELCFAYPCPSHYLQSFFNPEHHHNPFPLYFRCSITQSTPSSLMR